MTSLHDQNPLQIDFGKDYDGIVDSALTGLSLLILNMPLNERSPATGNVRSGFDRRSGDRRVGERRNSAPEKIFLP